jgi:protoheme IX farnesyltransferase
VNTATRFVPSRVPALTPELAVVTEASLGSALSELTKARLTMMVLLTTLTGYYLASQGPFDWLKLLHTLVGTTLVAVCSSILNQALERDTDALMHRTEMRPFVTRRLPLTPTVPGGVLLGALGLAELALFVNLPAALIAALTLAIYVAVYTPLKKLTTLNTLIGAIPGALPPLLGATAARGHFSVEGWTLFAILALWQLPHFYAISYLYREDYENAGLRMVSVNDPAGRRTGACAVISSLALLPVSLLPAWIGSSGFAYGIVAAILSLVFVAWAVRFARRPERATARALFLFSITYLPLILVALGVDRAFHS